MAELLLEPAAVGDAGQVVAPRQLLRKMTARLQVAGAPALLRTSATSGHGLGTPLDARIEEEVDVLAFLFDRLGVPVRTAATGGAATGQPERPGQP